MDWKCFLDRETEHNWEKRDLLMQTLSKHPIEIDRVQLDYVCSALQSLRTQLQFNALNAIESLIKSVPLDTYSEILLATLFKVISGSKKVILTPATNTAVLLMQNTQPTTRILAILSNMTQEKSVVVRTSSVLLLSHFYQNCLSNQWLTKSNSIDAFSKILERLLHDANPIVREQSRSLFLFFESNHPEQAHRLLGNVQDQIMKAIIKDRSKIAQSLLNKPIIPTASIASPKKVRSAAFINHVRNSSRDSMDSDVSANSMPSSYLSRPHTAKKDNDFFDNALDQINKTFGDISQSAIELPVLQDTADAMDIVINDGQIHKEVNDILTRSVDRFSVQDVNFLLTRIKKYKEWNVATCHALANKVITILTTSTQIDSKEDCFLLLQQVVLNLNEYLKGLELNLLTTSLLYINYDDDTVIAAGFYTYMAILDSLDPNYLIKPLYNHIQQLITEGNENTQFLVDLIEGLSILVNRLDQEKSKEYLEVFIKLLNALLSHEDATIRMLGYTGLSQLDNKLSEYGDSIPELNLNPDQRRILSVYMAKQ